MSDSILYTVKRFGFKVIDENKSQNTKSIMKKFTYQQDERMKLKDELIYKFYYDRGHPFHIGKLDEILKVTRAA